MPKRSRFIDALGIPKHDLRTKPKCKGCGVAVTSKNWAVTEESRQEYWCNDCFESDKWLESML